MAYLESFPSCCGIKVITDFGRDDEASRGLKLSDITLGQIKTSIKYKLTDSSNVGLVLIALNEIQVSAGIEKPVLECGFEKINTFYHPGHRRTITLYQFEHYPSKTGKVKDSPSSDKTSINPIKRFFG